jgi:hypothetical protein
MSAAWDILVTLDEITAIRSAFNAAERAMPEGLRESLDAAEGVLRTLDAPVPDIRSLWG